MIAPNFLPVILKLPPEGLSEDFLATGNPIRGFGRNEAAPLDTAGEID
jgi:hypothetical protein